MSLRLRQCCCRDLCGRFCQVLRYARRRGRFHITAGARAGRRGLLARGLVSHRSPAPLVERSPPVLLARGEGQHAEEGLHPCCCEAHSCPSASAASQGCPAAKVRMLWVHRRRLSTVHHCCGSPSDLDRRDLLAALKTLAKRKVTNRGQTRRGGGGEDAKVRTRESQHAALAHARHPARPER